MSHRLYIFLEEMFRCLADSIAKCDLHRFSCRKTLRIFYLKQTLHYLEVRVLNAESFTFKSSEIQKSAQNLVSVFCFFVFSCI